MTTASKTYIIYDHLGLEIARTHCRLCARTRAAVIGGWFEVIRE